MQWAGRFPLVEKCLEMQLKTFEDIKTNFADILSSGDIMRKNRMCTHY